MGSGLIDDGHSRWGSERILIEKRWFDGLMQRHAIGRLASLMDNSAAFVVIDECALEAGVPHVPLPTFFTPEQRNHALAALGAHYLIVEAAADHLVPGAAVERFELCGRVLVLKAQPGSQVRLPAGTVRVSFTSGSTGRPKGVCLSERALRGTANALIEATAGLRLRRHLSVLPFALLLENVAGLIAPRTRGEIECVIPPLAEVGLNGSSGFDVAKFDSAVRRFAPDSLIILPQMLKAWCGLLSANGSRPPSALRFVAVGGARVGEALIDQARTLGIPAYEGYGLTEAGSVVTLNVPGRDRSGSVGHPLSHVALRVNGQGEIEVRTPGFLGYVGAERDPEQWWPTGDLGRVDDQGFVHLSGRRGNLLITGFGRNVSPEWIEATLRAESAIQDAVVFGDGEAGLWAVVWPASNAIAEAACIAAIGRANSRLPDYAQIHAYLPARASLTAASGLATSNGRPLREAILASHRSDPRTLVPHPESARKQAIEFTSSAHTLEEK